MLSPSLLDVLRAGALGGQLTRRFTLPAATTDIACNGRDHANDRRPSEGSGWVDQG